jgi:hypothetical protein
MEMEEVTHYPIAPGRSCGHCSLCCKLLGVIELAKPANVWCPHCKPGKGGCGIYSVRPQICRTYACGWLMSETVGEEWYPLHSHMILTLAPINNVLTCTVTVDKQFPRIWREPPYYDQLKRMARTGMRVKTAKEILLVTVRCDGRVWLLMDDDDVEVTRLWYIAKFNGGGQPATVELFDSTEEAEARVIALTA